MTTHNGPVKAYTEQWYQAMRPDCTINHNKQVVDSKLIGVLNHEDDINDFVMKETNKKNIPINTRLLSADRKPRKMGASTDSGLKQK